MIHELTRVVLTEDVPEYNLQAGDLGVVVLVHREGEAYEVEFLTLEGDTVAVETLTARQVRPVRSGEIAHVRAWSNAAYEAVNTPRGLFDTRYSQDASDSIWRATTGVV